MKEGSGLRSELKRYILVWREGPCFWVDSQPRPSLSCPRKQRGGAGEKRGGEGHLFDFFMVKEVKSLSSCQGGKRWGPVWGNKHLKHLGQTG